ncbi:hypothetical protein FKM82_005926 [Ascaphus truei]
MVCPEPLQSPTPAEDSDEKKDVQPGNPVELAASNDQRRGEVPSAYPIQAPDATYADEVLGGASGGAKSDESHPVAPYVMSITTSSESSHR